MNQYPQSHGMFYFQYWHVLLCEKYLPQKRCWEQEFQQGLEFLSKLLASSVRAHLLPHTFLWCSPVEWAALFQGWRPDRRQPWCDQFFQKRERARSLFLADRSVVPTDCVDFHSWFWLVDTQFQSQSVRSTVAPVVQKLFLPNRFVLFVNGWLVSVHHRRYASVFDLFSPVDLLELIWMRLPP